MKNLLKKVAWLEGMLIRPQHFQQNDNYFESVEESKLGMLHNYNYGFSKLKINQNLLSHNKIQLSVCEGIFSDGTVFSAEEKELDSLLIALSAESAVEIIYLCLPIKHYATDKLGGSPDSNVRYLLTEGNVLDSISEDGESTEVILAELNLSIKTNNEKLDHFYYLPIAKIKRFDEEEGIVLDPDFIPECLNIHGINELKIQLKELVELVSHKQEKLAKRLVNPLQSQVKTSFTDVLLLQILNKFLIELTNTYNLPVVHAYSLYQIICLYLGEIATYVHPDKRVDEWPAYKHEDLSKTFLILFEKIKALLQHKIDQQAILIPLKEQDDGIRQAALSAEALKEDAKIILILQSDIPAQQVLQKLIPHVKIASEGKINQIINLQVSGVSSKLLPVAPGQLPYYSDASYLELENKGKRWDEIIEEKLLNIYLATEIEEVALSLWLIPSNKKELTNE